MKSVIDKILVYKNYSIRRTLEVLDSGAKGIVLLVDDDKKLLGTITDGDIRRAILKGISLEDSIEKVTHFNPVSVNHSMTKDEIKDIFIKKAVKDIPIVDENNIVIDLITINDILLPNGKENLVIIMAGGLGTRLKDLTREIPKPMLKVGSDPLLEHIINNFKKYGFNKFLFSVNYKAEIIENYFQNGIAYGVKINYIKEKKRLGTAGGIKLGTDYIDKDFFVINGDIFTNVNVEAMMNYHKENNFGITVGVRKYFYEIPYGVIEVENKNIKELKEKPTIDYLINGGIYCLSPSMTEFIPEDTYYEITDLINLCIEKGIPVGYYEITDYWMDIGKLEDYQKVNEDIYKLVALDREGD
ncbi:nucleotidyltransferase family protein [Clostridium sp. YIM B02551]|uniref:nucleotidyltransferase family protein n=1 Tax=Clostridium sp. YIM B02551 TaxID=2910679 RepID=UPI001EECC234|nr:nucleotidyltransferase family protein [Clostridium sp. YIM B02551]